MMNLMYSSYVIIGGECSGDVSMHGVERNKSHRRDKIMSCLYLLIEELKLYSWRSLFSNGCHQFLN